MPRYVKKNNTYKIVVIVLAVLILAAWTFTYIKVSEYEKGSTRHLMETVISRLEKQYDGEFSYKRSKFIDEDVEYIVLRDGKPFATTILNKSDKQGMLGFDLYTAGDTRGVESVSFLALPTDKALVGDYKQEGMNVKESGIPLPFLEDLSKHKTNTTCKVPEYNLYVVDGLFEKLPITTDAGDEILVETTKGTLLAHKMEEDKQKKLSSWTEDFVKRYTRYVVLGKGFDDIKNDIFYTSPIYNIVNKFRSMWDYYYDYDISIDQISFSDFIEYTDDVVSLRVRYKYTQSYHKTHTEHRPEINLFLYNNHGKWQVVEMQSTEWAE